MLNQLIGLSSPTPTPLTVLSASDLHRDLAELRAAAPDADVRPSPWALPQHNRVLVFDRCGRLVYQQTLQHSDTDMRSVQAAILSAHLQDPCGPCHLPTQAQEEPSETKDGAADLIRAEPSTSQAKMSGIANAYAPSEVANPTVRAEDADDAEETSTTTTTSKPERKKNNKKKNEKKKRKKGKHDKPRKGKRVGGGTTATPDDESLNEISEVANPTAEMPRSRVVWPIDGRTNEKRNGKENRMYLRAEAEEGIEIVKEEEELVEYPDQMDAGDDVFVEIENVIRGHSLGGEEDYRRIQEAEEQLSGIVRNVPSHLLGGEEDYRRNQGAEDELSGIVGNGQGHLLGGEEDYRRNQGAEDELSGIVGNGQGHLLGGEEDYRRIEDTEDELSSIVGNGQGHLLGGEEDYRRIEDTEDELSGIGGEEDYRKNEETEDELSGIVGNMQGHLLGSEEDYRRIQEAENELSREDDDANWRSEQREASRVADTPSEEQRDEISSTEFEEDDSKDGGQTKWIEKKRGESKSKRGSKKKEKKRVEGDAWERSDEYILRGETEGEERGMIATWRDATPRFSSSGGDSDDQTRRVALYESAGDSSSDRVAMLHSKADPWSKGKGKH